MKVKDDLLKAGLMEKQQQIVELEASQAWHRHMQDEFTSQITPQMQVVLDSMVELVIFQDRHNRILWANRAAAESVGMTPEELVGRHCYQVWNQRQPCDGCPVVKACETGKPQEAEITTPDGRTWLMQSNPARDDKGKVVGVVEVTLEITERKEKEREYQTIIHTTMDGFWIVDTQGRFLDVNDAYCNLVGYSRKELLNMSIQDIEAIEKPEETAQRIQKIIRTGFDRFETRHRCKDGRIIDMEVSTTYSSTGGGRFFVFIRDITERKHAEEVLKKSEEKYSTLVERGNDGIVIIQDGLVAFANSRMLKLAGVSSSEVQGKPFIDFVAPDYRPLVVDRYRRRMAGEEVPDRYEIEIVSKDGRKVPLEISASFGEYEGRPADMVVISDITERKQADEALRQAEEKYRSVVENAVEGIFQATPEGRYIMVNRAHAQIHGYESPEEFMNTITDIQYQLYVEPEDRTKFVKLLEKFGKVEGFEAQFYRKDGSKIWASLKARTVRDPSGTVLYYEGMVEDVTKRKEAEARLSKLYFMQVIEKNIAESLLRVRDEFELFQQVCDLLAKLEFNKFTWIGLVEKESYEVKPMAHAGFENGLLSVIRVTWDDSDYSRGPTGIAIKTGQPFVVPDIKNDPRHRPWREEVLKRGYVSSIALPIVHEGQVVGALNMYSGARDAFKDDEVGFLTRVANDIAVGVKTLRLQKDLERSLERAWNILKGTIDAVAAVSETRDPYTAGHQRRVAKLASAIAGEIALSKKQIEAVHVAGLLHDIGKVFVPAEILSKPGRLSEIEMSLVKAHSQASVDILKTIDFPWAICSFVLQHHERMDGSGYPKGLSGNDISLEARILGVADVVEAMASHRPYRSALGIDRALEEISRNKGKLYDPEVVGACLRLFTKKGFKFE